MWIHTISSWSYEVWVAMSQCSRYGFGKNDYFPHFNSQIVDKNSHTEWQTVQIQISWLLQKPTDLDLQCLLREGGYMQVSAGQLKVYAEMPICNAYVLKHQAKF